MSSQIDSEFPDPLAGIASVSADSHGQAAFLLVESLIHVLIARSVITVADAIEIVEVAIDVQEENKASLGDVAPVTLQTSITLLQTIASSLSADEAT